MKMGGSEQLSADIKVAFLVARRPRPLQLLMRPSQRWLHYLLRFETQYSPDFLCICPAMDGLLHCSALAENIQHKCSLQHMCSAQNYVHIVHIIFLSL